MNNMYLFSYLSVKRQMKMKKANFPKLFFFNLSELFICFYLEVQNINVNRRNTYLEPSQSSFSVTHKVSTVDIFVQLLMAINWKQLRAE